MNRSYTMAVVAVMAGMCVAGLTFRAHAELPAMGTIQLDVSSVATGVRSSTILGSIVRNETNEMVGRIDDLIVVPEEGSPFAVLSVQGYLGLGTRYVVVPYASFQLKGTQLILHGATRRALKTLPAFNYSS